MNYTEDWNLRNTVDSSEHPTLIISPLPTLHCIVINCDEQVVGRYISSLVSSVHLHLCASAIGH